MRAFKLTGKDGYIIAKSLESAERLAEERGYQISYPLSKLRIDFSKETVVDSLDDFNEV